MTVLEHKVPLRRRVWRRLRYPGIRFSPVTYTCTDPDCGCCYDKEPS